MNFGFILLWCGYGFLLVSLARWARGRDNLLPGRVGSAVQALAYVATYVSAVALVGFGGLCHRYGLQMLLIAAGNIWFGTWFVYRFLAWPTRLWQRRLGAKTPGALLGAAIGSDSFRVFAGLLTGGLLVVYASAVFKGAAMMLSGVTPLPFSASLWILVLLVALSVTWGGLRGVLYTEALQGGIMLVGVALLLFAVFKAVGGPATGLETLAALPPTELANRGFTRLSEGPQGLFVLTLAAVTSIGVWAQPQLIQRHFALASRDEARRAAPVAMLVIAVVVGGTYLAGGLSRLLIRPDEIASPDAVIPLLVSKLLSLPGQQIFAMAIVSASLSTASALLHIAAGSLGHDLTGRRLEGAAWKGATAACAVVSGLFAAKSGTIIALLCTTSWSLIASALLVPYLALLAGKAAPLATWSSSIGGLAASGIWYAAGFASTAKGLLGVQVSPTLSAIHPFFVGIAFSAGFYLLGMALAQWSGAKEPVSPAD
ncbi:MAG: sodium:solute symporter [Synergistales bacterium]|jgi:SSS family solute:Na+ symporter